MQQQLERLHAARIESLAIWRLHACKHAAHAERIEQLAGQVGFVQVSRSSVVAPLIEIVARGDTTSVDAYASSNPS